MMRPASPGDIDRAYRLILGRPVDEGGRAHYESRIAAGLSLNDLLAELLGSEEYRSKAGVPNPDETPASALEDTHESRDTALITPAQLLAKYSIDELNETADEYYRRIPDVTPLLIKPFFYLNETPEILRNLGILLGGLQLGKSMTVLDFGGGTGWLSRIFSQLNCPPICCDVSPAALEVAKQLFREHPPIGHFAPPTFLVFDGRTLALPDESVDRIVCFDAFHHVPNPDAVIAEFHRVLRPGGIVGFSEPGPHHSQSAQSQYEMLHHRVLENDIRLQDLTTVALAAGFTSVEVEVLAEGRVGPAEHAQMIAPSVGDAASQAMVTAVRNSLLSHSIFFFRKGELRLDSRTHTGLRHELSVTPERAAPGASGHVTLHVTARNTGEAHWIHAQNEIFGIVRVGTHLYDAAGHLMSIDHSRHDLPRAVAPGEAVTVDIEVPVPAAGNCRLVVDLVAEGVTWFENAGSTAQSVPVVRPPV